MITHIRGRLTEKNPAYVVIDCHGVGYLIHISLNTFEKISDQEQIKLYTHPIIREDSQTLYGFYDTPEREVFKLLINVNGVGPSTARMVLSTLTPDEFRKAVVNSDVNTVKSVKGVGPKSAQRIIIELKDKLSKILTASELSLPIENQAKQEAFDALEVLGFTKRQVGKTIEGLVEEDPTLSVEELIKLTLKKL